MNSLRDQSLLVLGLGDSGLAMCAWALGHGAAQVKVWDSRANPPQLATLREQHPSVEFFRGELMAAHLLGVDRVFKSPGLSPRDARLGRPTPSACRCKASSTCSRRPWLI